MENNKKKSIAENLIKLLNKEVPVSKAKLKDDDTGYSVIGYIYKGVDLDYTIRKNGDIALCKITVVFKEDENINKDVIAEEFAKTNNMNYTSYDGSYKFQSVITFENDDKKTENKLKDTLLGVIDAIDKYQEYFEIVYKTTIEESESPNASEDAEPEEDVDTNTDTNNETNNEPDVDNVQEQDIVDEIGEIISDNQKTDKKAKVLTPKRARHQKKSKINTSGSDPVEVKTEPATESIDESISSGEDLNKTQFTASDDKDMYESINALFEKKKQDADKRQELLNKFSESLRQKEIELDVKKKEDEKELTKKEVRLEKEFDDKHKQMQDNYAKKMRELEEEYSKKNKEIAIKEVELDKGIESLNNDKKKLEIEWKKYQMQLSDLDEKKKEINEMIDINSKLGIDTSIDHENIPADSNVSLIKLQNDYNDLVDENSDLIDENNELIDENEKLTKELDQYKSKCQKMQSRADKSEALANQYKEQLDNAGNNTTSDDGKYKKLYEELLEQKNESNTKSGDDNYKEQYLKADEEARQYKETAEQLRQAEANKESELNEIKDKYQNLQEEMERLKAASNEHTQILTNGSSENIATKANRVKSELAKIGVDVEPVVGADDSIYSAKKNNCLICINLKHEILYVEKTVKKPAKYARTLEQWNLEDIRVAYSISGRKIICKFAYDNILANTQETLNNFDTLI